MFWMVLNDSSRWQELAADYRERYRSLVPMGLDPSLFLDRGAYGDYYANQLSVIGGY